ncbi:glycoside hydrolase family 9 protein [Aquimarina megaterium]|uniref:glycoside hydrolase family 9 protein n=1 Tax=Aquimarina megaterium TaxID=1443666 RepID=UPI0004BC090D|nr:glycoside hydrolase family 9 protein [Aquimarina megaterium]
MKNLVKVAFWLLFCVFSVPSTAQSFNYGEALQKSIFFYEVQQSGKLPDWNRVSWRDDSAINDGSGVNKDLTGGWYDAGDHVKFGFPMAYSATMLAWGAIEYEDAYRNSGQLQHIKNNLRFVCDYFIKCHTAPNEFYGQVGNGGADHAWWGAAEVMPMARPAYKITKAKPGTELAGETAAALAAASIVFKDSDPTYSATLLSHAEQLYDFADKHRGDYSISIPDVQQYYKSWSGFKDEIVWGATWLYEATKKQSYLDKAESEYDNMNNEPQSTTKSYKWGLAWDDKSYGCYILLSKITGKNKYKIDAERHLDYWTTGYNGERVPYSAGGQAHLTQWGSLRHTANTSFLAFVYSDHVDTPKKATYLNFAKRQINYILGDNPRNSSYVVGFGNNSPKNPHHRTAHGTWTNNLTGLPKNNRHITYGALVGGPPSANDQYVDDRGDYVANEVACDYNAAFTGTLARMYKEFGGTPLANFPIKETPKDEFLADAKFNSNNQNGITVSVMAKNHTAWPARTTKNLSFRYFFDISEAVNSGYTISDYTIKLSYVEGNGKLKVRPWDAAKNIYYAEVSFPNDPVAPIGESPSRREAQLRIEVKAGMPWNLANDYSADGLNGSTRINSQKIPMYDKGILIHGKEPKGKPIAVLSANVTTGNAPLEVSFDASGSSDPEGDALFYSWDFGNGQTSTEEKPVVTYAQIGSYVVTLTVSDGTDVSTPVTETITVIDGNILIADFVANPTTGIAPVTVSFDASASSDSDGNPLTYAWDFGDGTTGSGVIATHEYTTVGTYSVKLTVSNGNKVAVKTLTVTISDGKPIASFTADPEEGFIPLLVNFDASASVDPSGGTLTYQWDLGNGETATSETASTTYTAVGDFTVTLTVTNQLGKTDTATKVIKASDGSVDCAFGTPLDSGIPSIHQRYDYIHVLGQGGPDFSNVTHFVLNWDNRNNGLYQFSMNTNNGVPNWYVDMLGKITHNLKAASPSVTLTGTGFPKFDGSYYAAQHEGNFVLVSKNKGFTVYFSTSATPPDCSSSLERTAMKNKNSTDHQFDITISPNPVKNKLTIVGTEDLKGSQIIITNLAGEVIRSYAIGKSKKSTMIRVDHLSSGLYLAKVTTVHGKHIVTKFIIE